MTTHRVTNRTRFTVVDQATINDRRLSFRARGVLVWLLDKPDDWNCDAMAISRAGKEGRGAVRAALTELEGLGYIARERTQDDLGRWSTSTAIHERPAEVQIPVVGEPDVGPADVGDPVASQAPSPMTDTAAACAPSELSTGSSTAVELPLPEVPVSKTRQACHQAAVASHKAEAALTGQRITNVGRYALGRAGDYRASYGAHLDTMEAQGATEAEMIAYIQDREADPLLQGHGPLVVYERPQLPEYRQAEFEDPDAAPPIDIDERRARIAENRARIAEARRQTTALEADA